jgi:hypothetical protein
MSDAREKPLGERDRIRQEVLRNSGAIDLNAASIRIGEPTGGRPQAFFCILNGLKGRDREPRQSLALESKFENS